MAIDITIEMHKATICSENPFTQFHNKDAIPYNLSDFMTPPHIYLIVMQ